MLIKQDKFGVPATANVLKIAQATLDQSYSLFYSHSNLSNISHKHIFYFSYREIALWHTHFQTYSLYLLATHTFLKIHSTILKYIVNKTLVLFFIWNNNCRFKPLFMLSCSVFSWKSIHSKHHGNILSSSWNLIISVDRINSANLLYISFSVNHIHPILNYHRLLYQILERWRLQQIRWISNIMLYNCLIRLRASSSTKCSLSLFGCWPYLFFTKRQLGDRLICVNYYTLSSLLLCQLAA